LPPALAEKVTMVDAAEMLASFMREGMPREELFRGAVESAFSRARAGVPGGGVRAYGEMVDLLCRDGNFEAAVRLEELWNEIGAGGRLSLLCAYDLSGLGEDAHGPAFERICDVHDRVAPAEGFPSSGDPKAAAREVARLQRCARALDNELARRRRNEAFLSALGHDLRNPLSGITTAAHLLARRAGSDKMLMPAVRILRSADRMGRMVDQLLDFVRIQLGQGLPIRRRTADLGEVCRVAVDELESASGVECVNVDVDADTVGMWDADRLGQLASNLIDNAIAHGRDGGPVLVRVADLGNNVGLEVCNAGALAPEMLPVLFEPLRAPLQGARSRSSGLGLGLYISRQIVIAHGGTIAVTSSETDGTRIAIKLPRDLPGSAQLIRDRCS
jgi:signal transduction histidine kinase